MNRNAWLAGRLREAWLPPAIGAAVLAVWFTHPDSPGATAVLVALQCLAGIVSAGWSLALLAFTLPFERPFELSWGTVHTGELQIVAALAGWIVRAARRPGLRIWREPVLAAWIPFLVVLALSSFTAEAPFPWQGGVRWLEWLAAFALAAQALRSPGEVERVAWAAVTAGVAVAGVGLAEFMGWQIGRASCRERVCVGV